MPPGAELVALASRLGNADMIPTSRLQLNICSECTRSFFLLARFYLLFQCHLQQSTSQLTLHRLPCPASGDLPSQSPVNLAEFIASLSCHERVALWPRGAGPAAGLANTLCPHHCEHCGHRHRGQSVEPFHGPQGNAVRHPTTRSRRELQGRRPRPPGSQTTSAAPVADV